MSRLHRTRAVLLVVCCFAQASCALFARRERRPPPAQAPSDGEALAVHDVEAARAPVPFSFDAEHVEVVADGEVPPETRALAATRVAGSLQRWTPGAAAGPPVPVQLRVTVDGNSRRRVVLALTTTLPDGRVVTTEREETLAEDTRVPAKSWIGNPGVGSNDPVFGAALLLFVLATTTPGSGRSAADVDTSAAQSGALDDAMRVHAAQVHAAAMRPAR